MKIIVISEFNLSVGSGYTTIARPLAAGLGYRGHDVKVVGHFYDGCEHRLPITVMTTDPRWMMQHMQRLAVGFRPDALIGIADITMHVAWQQVLELGIPYLGIFPLESDPLMHPSEWTRVIDLMGAALVETEWATELCKDVALDVRHIPIGVDAEFWRPPSAEERDPIRKRLGVGEKWVILCVADNHERKNMPAVFAAAALASGREITWPPASGKAVQPVARWDDLHLIVNTKRRPDHVGYQMWNLADTFRLQNETTFYQHEKGAGLSDVQLRDLYWAADTFVLLSKAEGLGLPVLEAMACGLPCVCTDAGGMSESLAHGRGWLVEPEYSYIDPFGNQTRRFPSPLLAAKALADIRKRRPGTSQRVQAALAWARERTWHKAIDVVEEALNVITQEAQGPALATGPAPPAGWPGGSGAAAEGQP